MKLNSISINLICCIKRVIINNIWILQATLMLLKISLTHFLKDFDFHNKRRLLFASMS